MSIYHDEIEIEDMEYDEDTETYYYPCPCGDTFAITKEELQSGEIEAKCPSCSLVIKVIYDISGDPHHIASPRPHPQDNTQLHDSVLHDILTTKKLALLRSPDVQAFLRQHQEQVRESALCPTTPR